MMMTELFMDLGGRLGVRVLETNHMKQSLFIFIFFLLVHTSSNAGSLINGSWSPSGCGEKPKSPIVDSSSAEKFNQSVDAINDWQDRAISYHSCLVNEANADSKLITDTANDMQAEFQKEIDRVVTEADNARAALDDK